jgi:hypothetical protein
MRLVRIVQRRASWEDGTSFDDFFQTEFCDGGAPDLELSVYDTEPPQRLQVYAEYCAGVRGGRPGTGAVVLLDDGHPSSKVMVKPSDVPFAFLSETHRELVHPSGKELQELAAKVRVEKSSRYEEIKTPEVKAYVRARKEARDPEWLAVIATNERWDL